MCTRYGLTLPAVYINVVSVPVRWSRFPKKLTWLTLSCDL